MEYGRKIKNSYVYNLITNIQSVTAVVTYTHQRRIPVPFSPDVGIVRAVCWKLVGTLNANSMIGIRSNIVSGGPTVIALTQALLNYTTPNFAFKCEKNVIDGYAVFEYVANGTNIAQDFQVLPTTGIANSFTAGVVCVTIEFYQFEPEKESIEYKSTPRITVQ